MGLDPKRMTENMRRCMAAPEPSDHAPVAIDLGVSERKMQDEIANYLLLHEIPFFRQRMDKRTTGTVGWPDFTFVVIGRACFLEVKRPGESPSEDQERVIAALKLAGAFVQVVYSGGEGIAVIQKILNCEL